MKKTLALLALATMSSHTLPSDDGGLEPVTTPSPIRNFADLTITETGVTARAAGEPLPECREFTLSTAEAIEFFRNARQVDRHDFSHMLDWSPCFVKGTLTLANGDKATWAVHQFRAGSVLLKNGETISLYCPHCRAKAFPPTE